MKTLKLLLVLFVSISLLSTGCDKNDDDPSDPGANFKGNFSVNIDGANYNTLQSDIIEFDLDSAITFLASDNNGGQFQIAISNMPAVGSTSTLSIYASDEETIVLVANGPIDGIISLVAGAGTVYCESADKYVLENIVLYGGTEFAEEFPMNGTINVGVHNTK